MKILIKHTNSGIENKHYKFIENFINYLQKNYPLKNDLTIHFLGDRLGGMSTGSRKENYLKILSKNRMNRDILRTLAHEWVHEYHHTIENREFGPDIGGKNEDDANSEAGKVIKKFEKDYPKSEPMMYEQKKPSLK